MQDWGKVAVATRLNDRCDPVFFNCWSHQIAAGLRKGDTLMDAGIELPQHFAATVITRYFLKSDADTFLMVDSDMVFKPDTLTRLRDDSAGWEYDVLSALTVSRRRPFLPVLFRIRKDLPEGERTYECVKPEPGGKIMPMDAVGMCYTLIRRSLFDKIKDQLDIDRWFFEWGLGGLGEDTQFCQRTQAVGGKIGVHTGVNIGHRGPVTFKWDPEKEITVMETNDQIKDILGE